MVFTGGTIPAEWVGKREKPKFKGTNEQEGDCSRSLTLHMRFASTLEVDDAEELVSMHRESEFTGGKEGGGDRMELPTGDSQ